METYFCREILRRSDPNNAEVKTHFPTPHEDLEYTVLDIHHGFRNPPPYGPQPSNSRGNYLRGIRRRIRGNNQNERVSYSTLITRVHY
jgi:hypothetical protein